MAIAEIKWDPTRKELRDFGTGGTIILPIVAAVLAISDHYNEWWWEPKYSIYVASYGVFLFLLSRVSLRATKPVFVGMMIVAWPIGTVVGYMGFASIYFLVITPIALIMKMMGRDALQLKIDRQAKSYWQDKNVSDDMGRYYRQF